LTWKIVALINKLNDQFMTQVRSSRGFKLIGLLIQETCLRWRLNVKKKI